VILKILLLLFYFFFFLIFPIKSYFTIKKLDSLDQTVIYSSHSFLLENQLRTQQCIDNKIDTSCFEICFDNLTSKEKTLYIKNNECAFVWQISPSHNMGKFPPKKNRLYRFGIYLSESDIKYSIPKKIRLMLYQQKLYHINRDYRFPDQPVYEKEVELYVKNQKGWQYWNIEEFNVNLKESKQFPDNVYQRWFKIVIEDVYNPQKQKISISEFFYQDEFLNSNEI